MTQDIKLHTSRLEFEKLGTLYSKSDNVTVEKEIIENVNCYWFNPKVKSNANRMIIYLHGGCFVLGSIQSHQSMVSHLSDYLSLRILFIEYSLAPEKPYPGATNEIEKVYKRITAEYPQNQIILMGDSAGGGLAISILSHFSRENIKSPIYLIMLSPWIDLNCTNDSLIKNKDLDPILTKDALQEYASMYVDGNKLSDANPVENMNGKYPPTLVLVGSGEILLDDGKFICRKIQNNQKKVRLSIYDKQHHVWLLEDIHSEASSKALGEIKEFIVD